MSNAIPYREDSRPDLYCGYRHFPVVEEQASTPIGLDASDLNTFLLCDIGVVREKLKMVRNANAVQHNWREVVMDSSTIAAIVVASLAGAALVSTSYEKTLPQLNVCALHHPGMTGSSEISRKACVGRGLGRACKTGQLLTAFCR